MGVLTPTTAASTAASGAMNSAPNRFWKAVTNSAEPRHQQPARHDGVDGAGQRGREDEQVAAQRGAAARPPPSSTRATTPANDSGHAEPLAARAALAHVRAFSTSTKIGMVAIRMAASLALVWAMPRFSKVK